MAYSWLLMLVIGHSARHIVTIINQRSSKDERAFSLVETARDLPPRPGLHQRHFLGQQYKYRH